MVNKKTTLNLHRRFPALALFKAALLSGFGSHFGFGVRLRFSFRLGFRIGLGFRFGIG